MIASSCTVAAKMIAPCDGLIPIVETYEPGGLSAARITSGT